MKLPAFIKDNLLLKITSLNSGAIGIRVILGVISQRIVAEKLGPAGVAFIGDLRNMIPMIQSFSTLGMFNGIVIYVTEHKENKEELLKLFSKIYSNSLNKLQRNQLFKRIPKIMNRSNPKRLISRNNIMKTKS